MWIFESLCIFSNSASFQSLILKFQKSRQNFERWFSRWVMHALQEDFVMTVNCSIHYALHDEIKLWNCIVCEIFCDRRLLHVWFMLYFSIVCYEIHIKLAHVNARWIETIVYRMTYHETFARSFLIHARMSKSCQDVCIDFILQFMTLRTC